jgi:hypothetical protein
MALVGSVVVAVGPARAATGTVGNTAVGTQLDTDNANHVTLSRFATGPTAVDIVSMSAYVGPVQAAPRNLFQLGVYTDSGGRPGTLVAHSTSGTLTANAWNTVAVTATLAANTPYWFGYNTNATSASLNNIRYNNGGTSTWSQSGAPYGTWPSTFLSAPVGGANLSIYATYSAADPPPPPPLPDGGPGGPVLVIATSANPFSAYYSEILTAEGLAHYRVRDIATVTASVLSGYEVAVLGEMALTDAQVATLTAWVEGGGRLIAMRPDKLLAPLLGLSDAGSTLTHAWLRVANSGPGAGIVNSSIQYKGPADRYTLAGATALATLYATAAAATPNPAVSTRDVGSQGGQAAAFAYDLARSIVLTRQGNVAWAGQQRDGVDGYEAAEMFMGAPSGEPDWNDLGNAIVPIADEQQRLLANMILRMSRQPLPRFWYYPRDEKAVIVMTGDDHAHNGTTGRFNQYLAYSQPGCVLADWECVRSTSYVYPDTPLTNSQAASYHAMGFEIGLHNSTNCQPWGTPEALAATYTNQLALWRSVYPSLPSPTTTRTHCVEWDDWATQPRTKLAHGIRLDTDYYYYPASWVNNRPGYFNGTGTIMRFADQDGSLIDVYQATTQLTDESGQTYPFALNALLDKAFGPEGYYAAITANIHTDTAASPASDAIIAEALGRGVPVISARQMLDWLDARNASAYQSITWNGNALGFTVTGGANGLRGMVPLTTSAGSLVSLTRAGTPVPLSAQAVKGVSYGFFTAQVGDYVASYSMVDNVPPTVASTNPVNGADGVATNATVSVTFNEAMDASTITAANLELRTGAGALVGRTVTYNAGPRTATVTPTAPLSTGTTYTTTVRTGVRDAAGNPMAADHQVSFTTVAGGGGRLGYDQVGAQTDSGAQNYMNGSRFVTGAGGLTASAMSVYMRAVATARSYQMAIYTDEAGVPGTLVASTATGTLTANAWNTLPIAATLSGNTAYWLMYNTNGDNNMAFDTGAVNQGAWSSGATPFGAWPTAFGPATRTSAKFSLYVTSATGDTVGPTVASTDPVNGAGGVAVNSAVTVTFDETMTASTITAANLELRDGGGALVGRTVTYDAATTTATVTPTAILAANTTYTLTVRGAPGGVRDAAGNVMATDHQVMFSTATGGAPAILGHDQIGAQTDTGDQNYMNGSRFVTGPTGLAATTMSVYMRTVAATRSYQMAIYTDSGGVPGTLVATTGTGTLTANAWNTLPIAATLAGNTAYWLMYNTNGDNNMAFDTGAANQGAWSSAATPFGTWPASFGPATRTTARFSIYAR